MFALLSSQQALFATISLYLAFFLLIDPRHATPLRLAASREAISIVHCTLMTILAIICLRRELTHDIVEPWAQKTLISNLPPRGKIVDSQLPIITRKSDFANTVTAIETGYLMQDSLILLYAWKQQHAQSMKPKASKNSHTARQQLRGLNFLHLTLHHALLGGAFAILQFYISRGRERGILIIVMLLLMNASSPFGALRWFLINFCPERKRVITAVTVVYLLVFGLCRIFLIYWILEMFGRQQFGYGGWNGAWDTFLHLRVWCMLGTGSLGLVNTLWLLNGVLKVTGRLLSHKEKTG